MPTYRTTTSIRSLFLASVRERDNSSRITRLTQSETGGNGEVQNETPSEFSDDGSDSRHCGVLSGVEFSAISGQRRIRRWYLSTGGRTACREVVGAGGGVERSEDDVLWGKGISAVRFIIAVDNQVLARLGLIFHVILSCGAHLASRQFIKHTLRRYNGAYNNSIPVQSSVTAAPTTDVRYRSIA